MRSSLRCFTTDRLCLAPNGRRSSKGWRADMSKRWKPCVAAILITGSTSSTYGADEAFCDAPPPASIEAALKTRPAMPLPIPYREDTYHAALLTPVITSGTYDLADDGALLRHQTAPRKETTEIGERFIKVRREGYENTVPIPSRIAPSLDILRSIVRGDAIAINSFEPSLSNSDDGWAVTLAGMTVRGCGDVLTRFVLTERHGERREIVFTPR